METSPLICAVNQWTGFYMITASVMKELKGEQYWNSSKTVIIPSTIYTKYDLFFRMSVI